MWPSVTNDPRRRLGDLGEDLACRHLEARGFEILDRNFRTRYGELDVVAAHHELLVFCEVKARISHGPSGPFGPFAAIGTRKRRQVRLMAREWLGSPGRETPGCAGRPYGTGRRPSQLRFDAIGVTLDPTGRLRTLEHLENAF